MTRRVRKTIFSAGGLDTRSPPATRSTLEETLSVIDTPLTQYAFEAAAAGIGDFIFVAEHGKRQKIEALSRWLPQPREVAYIRNHKWTPLNRIGVTELRTVEHDGLISPLRQCLSCMAADIAGSACQENAFAQAITCADRSEDRRRPHLVSPSSPADRAPTHRRNE